MRSLALLLSSLYLTALVAAKKATPNENNSTTAATGAVGTNCNIIANRTVVAGDNLANIATSTNTTLAQLLFVNTKIANPRAINVGDMIAIPNSACVAPAAAPLAEPTATCVDPKKGGVGGVGKNGTTTVVTGDTLNIIAKEKLGITLPALVAANPQITNLDAINVGDVINVPLCGAATGGKGNGTTTEKAPKKQKQKTGAKTVRRSRVLWQS